LWQGDGTRYVKSAEALVTLAQLHLVLSMASASDGVLQCGRLFPSTVLNIFKNADADKDGIVSGKEAVDFFSSTGVDKQHLRSVWNIVTDSQPGGLTPVHFSRALRLISLLQTGCEFTDEFIAKALHPQTGLQLPEPQMGSQYLKPPRVTSVRSVDHCMVQCTSPVLPAHAFAGNGLRYLCGMAVSS
jgi:hypothetical protein